MTGGCLSVIAASIGTPYEIQTEGKILFLEDQGEPPYRLDRMITHLFLADKLHSLAGVLLGDFVDCKSDSRQLHRHGYAPGYLCVPQHPGPGKFSCRTRNQNWALPFGVTMTHGCRARERSNSVNRQSANRCRFQIRIHDTLRLSPETDSKTLESRRFESDSDSQNPNSNPELEQSSNQQDALHAPIESATFVCGIPPR